MVLLYFYSDANIFPTLLCGWVVCLVLFWFLVFFFSFLALALGGNLVSDTVNYLVDSFQSL